MDVSTIIGLVLGLGLVVGAITMSGSIRTFIDPASLAIVIGGSFAALLVSFPLQQALRVFALARKLFFTRPADPVAHVRTLVNLADAARRDGILGIEPQLAQAGCDDFMVRGLRMVIDGQDRQAIESTLHNELHALAERHATGKRLFEAFGRYATAFGLIGALIGLVVMLQNMDDGAGLGQATAVSLVTTFYGVLAANLFALPLADKLAVRSGHETALKSLIIHGVLCIQAGENPRLVQQKLGAFLEPAQRARLDGEA